MNRDLVLLTYLLEENINQRDQMPAWAKAERLGYCDQLSRESVKPQKRNAALRHIKLMTADTLRKAANKLDPVHMVS